MNWLLTIFLLLLTWLAVFCECAIHLVRNLTGVQIHLLPAIAVFAALNAGLTNVTLVSLVGGLAFDSLSANPLGVSVLPLFAIGSLIHSQQDLILKDHTFAQAIIGGSATAVWFISVLVLLLTTGQKPLLGWGTLWQLVMVTLGGAIVTPAIFSAHRWVQATFGYHRITESSFRQDREIRRGR